MFVFMLHSSLFSFLTMLFVVGFGRIVRWWWRFSDPQFAKAIANRPGAKAL
jgi:hypothetical protein